MPSLWALEVANVLLVGERRGRVLPEQAAAWLPLMRDLRIHVDDQTFDKAFTETLALARTHRLTVYDASYLELALRRRLPMATLDRQLRAAAGAAGVPLFTP